MGPVRRLLARGSGDGAVSPIAASIVGIVPGQYNHLFPLERAAEIYERMMSGKALFRVVLTTG
jgi:hypothetical protein